MSVPANKRLNGKNSGTWLRAGYTASYMRYATSPCVGHINRDRSQQLRVVLCIRQCLICG